MHRHLKRTFKIIGTAIFVLFIAFIIWFISGEGVEPATDIQWGVTFSSRQTDHLGLSAGKVYQALLDDMGARHIRLMAPWYQVEPAPGQYDFSDVDWYVREAQKRGAQVVLAVGRKLYRWPECHEPGWAVQLPPDKFEAAVLHLLTAEINHFKQFDNIVGWQVENEALLPFGECADPQPNWALLQKELALARSLDSRPVISTESGELSSWLKIGGAVDRLGVSLYRVTHNPWLGKFYYPFRPGFYQKKAKLAQALDKNLQKIFVSELQLEPWGDKPLNKMTVAEQFDSMSLERTQATIDFAQRAGFDEIYLWGVEWWYWLKYKQLDSRFWNLGKELMASSR